MNELIGCRSRVAAVVDGDNLTQGGQIDVPEVARVLERLAHALREYPVTFAMQSKLAARYMTAYSGLGWGVRFASMEPDAADHLLVEAAAEHARHAVTDLVVASGDHAFAELAGSARLHVLSYRSSLSGRLKLAATSVTYLDDLIPLAA
jgi:hypothetical protein